MLNFWHCLPVWWSVRSLYHTRIWRSVGENIWKLTQRQCRINQVRLFHMVILNWINELPREEGEPAIIFGLHLFHRLNANCIVIAFLTGMYVKWLSFWPNLACNSVPNVTKNDIPKLYTVLEPTWMNARFGMIFVQWIFTHWPVDDWFTTRSSRMMYRECSLGSDALNNSTITQQVKPRTVFYFFHATYTQINWSCLWPSRQASNANQPCND